MHDILSNIKIEQLLAPQAVQAAAVNSGNIDRLGCEAVAVAVLVGNIADTLGPSVRLDLKIEHADDDGTGSPAAYANCGDEDVLGATGLASGVFKQVNGAGDKNKRHCIEYRGAKRFVRVTATPVSLASGGPVAILSLKANAAAKPVAN